MVATAVSLAAIVLAAMPPARAGHPPKGSGSETSVPGSHLKNPRRGMVEVGFHPLGNKGFNTDVWAWTNGGRLYATTGTWGAAAIPGVDSGDACPSENDDPANPTDSGVKIVDATVPSKPKLVARLGTTPGSQNNDVKVNRVRTASFKGDLLAQSLEPCGTLGLLGQIPGSPVSDPLLLGLGAVDASVTGFQLWDVSNPRKPERLGTYTNGGIGTHQLYMYNRPDLGRSYVAAVYNEVILTGELFDIVGQLQLVEVTDPRNPTLVGTWDLFDEEIDCQERGDIAYCFLHDVWLSRDGKTASLSYWDAGLIVVDVSDPANPRMRGQALTQVQGDKRGWLDEEGNTHSAIPYSVGGRELVVVTDEDFTGGAPKGSNGYMVRVNSPKRLARDIPAMLWTGSAEPGRNGVRADLVYGGTGCTAVSYAPAAGSVSGNAALVDDRESRANPADQCPTYVFAQKTATAEAAGASALVSIAEGEPFQGDALASGIPAVEIPARAGKALRDAVLAGERVNVTVRKGLVRGIPVDPWGFLRVVDVTSKNPAKWREVFRFKAPHVETLNPAAADVFSAHDPYTGPDGRIYVAWYTDGVRVLEPVGKTGRFRQVAWFVPRASDHPNDLDEDPRGLQEANFGFWGAYPIRHPKTKQLLVFATDLNRGMYVLRVTL